MASRGAFAAEEPGVRRDIVTPEGMPVPVFLAARSQRAGALYLDLLLMLIAVIVLGVIVCAVVGGTWVVSVPKKRLRQDLAGSDVASTAWQQRKMAQYQFSQEQLEAYGIFELQTLETA